MSKQLEFQSTKHLVRVGRALVLPDDLEYSLMLTEFALDTNSDSNKLDGLLVLCPIQILNEFHCRGQIQNI